MKETDKTIESIARMLSRAYWRGRYDAAYGVGNVTGERLELMNEEAEMHVERWKAIVRVSIEDGGIVVEADPVAQTG